MRAFSEKSPARAGEEEEGEGAGATRRRGGRSRGGDDDSEGGGRSKRGPLSEDIWSDNTEPKWREIAAALNAESGAFDNVLELTL